MSSKRQSKPLLTPVSNELTMPLPEVLSKKLEIGPVIIGCVAGDCRCARQNKKGPLLGPSPAKWRCKAFVSVVEDSWSIRYPEWCCPETRPYRPSSPCGPCRCRSLRSFQHWPL